MTSAFLTGSRAYGTPRPDSDVDIVVPVQKDAVEKIKAALKAAGIDTSGTEEYADFAFRVGLVNVLLVPPEVAEKVWKAGTEFLIGQAPVTREKAVETFKALESLHRPKDSADPLQAPPRSPPCV